MKKTYLLMITMILSLIFFAGCEKTSIKIGYVGGLTGTNSELGVSGMYGAQLAVEAINHSGGINGRMLELSVKDDKDDKEFALQVDQQLVEEGCLALVGHMTSNMAELTIPFIDENKVLMISPTIATSSLSGMDDYFLRLIPSTEEQAKRIAMEIKKLDLKDILIFYSNGNLLFAQSLSDYLVKQLGDSDIQVKMMESIKIEDPSAYKEIADSIDKTESDGLVIIASADIVYNLGQELYLLNSQKNVFLPAWSMTNDLLRRGGAAVEGFYGVSFIDYSSKAEAYTEFKVLYQKKYGEQPTFSSILSYESVMVLAEALKTVEDFDSEALKNAILKQSTFQGLQSKITIDSFGDTQRDIFLYQIKNNEFNKVDN